MTRLQKILLLVLLAAIMASCDESDHDHQEGEEFGLVPEVEQLEVEEVEIILNERDGEVSLARNFYFVFDGSGSMDEQCAGLRKMDGAVEAVSKFINKIPDDAHIGLAVFDNNMPSHEFREALPLQADSKQAFMDEVVSIIPGGGTPLGECIQFGVDALVEQYKKQLGYGEFRLIVVTDGMSNGTVNIPEAAAYALQYRIPIYAIGLCMEEDHELRAYAMSYRDADNYEDLTKALEETVAETEHFDVENFDID